MKEPERLIREYYSRNNITHGAPLLFSYVRKDKWGGDGCVVEYYAAKYGHLRGKKGKDIATKLVMKFNPDTYRYSMSDSVVRYQTWSTLTMDHLIFDFHREISGSHNYSKRLRDNRVGGNTLNRLGKWRYEVMPTSEIPLNDFTGTKYQWCKYVYKNASICASNVHSYAYWAKNPYGNLPDYLRKYNLNPQAMELFASKGLVGYMKEDFLIRLRDDQPFAKWYRKHAIALIDKSPYQIANAARKEIGKTDWEIVRDEDRRLLREKRKRKLARENRAEMRRMREIEERQRNEKAERKQRLLDLYNRLKSICTIYGCYEVIVPKNEREMLAEGKKMHNCIGKCYPCRQGVDAIVVFLHRDGKPCVDVEIDMFTFKVKQCRIVCNKEADEKQKQIAEEVANNIRKVWKEVA